MEDSSIIDDDQTKTRRFAWTVEHERILVEWADKAMCFRWLHSKANAMYTTLNALYTIPVIVISTLTGTANFAQERVPENFQNYFAMIVGGFNILAGIITTVQQFLKITQLNEAHRVSSIAWDKFYRNIKIELAKHPDERMDVTHMIKMCKEEFDRLMETSPIIPDKVVEEFKTSFAGAELFDVIAKPEICDALFPTDKYRNPWFSDENQEKQRRQLADTLRLRQQQELDRVEQEKKKVEDFKQEFFRLHYRWPLDNEIIDNLKDSMEVATLQKYIMLLRSDIANPDGPEEAPPV